MTAPGAGGTEGTPTEGAQAGRDDRGDQVRRQRLVELVVHDLRNPLAALLGNLELMREELVDATVTATVRESLDDCSQLATRALSLVACILDTAELEAGDLRVERAPVDVNELVERARQRNAAGIRIRDVRFEAEVPARFAASLDASLAERVLEHLLDNALRFARRGGRVVVTARHDGDWVEIAVGNDGPPVPARERETIFGRHYRTEARRASAHRGLGLYFCRLAVEAHGGTIAVEQRGDLGAVFVARFPPG
ncbi:MAG: HAMP domain-containing histidine kinase [Kofleriaceae bacterium]|nr:HAMP domain-containing histidine kinase [Myxococcales bacterium]MCB9564381.1 HAMP domain-containing histidine kinase [Kofleriaceae bacterium]MCB9574809.1 HAMP domain-containing histidine kinase [Kofleriaceae bacterium]